MIEFHHEKKILTQHGKSSYANMMYGNQKDKNPVGEPYAEMDPYSKTKPLDPYTRARLLLDKYSEAFPTRVMEKDRFHRMAYAEQLLLLQKLPFEKTDKYTILPVQIDI